jgi:hypothetical protein
MDESNATCGKRLDSIGVENTEENRRAYRELLISAPGERPMPPSELPSNIRGWASSHDPQKRSAAARPPSSANRAGTIE